MNLDLYRLGFPYLKVQVCGDRPTYGMLGYLGSRGFWHCQNNCSFTESFRLEMIAERNVTLRFRTLHGSSRFLHQDLTNSVYGLQYDFNRIRQMGKGNHSLSNLLTPLISFVLGLEESRVPSKFLEDSSRYANIFVSAVGLKVSPQT